MGRNGVFYVVLLVIWFITSILYNEYVTALVLLILLAIPVFLFCFLIFTVPFLGASINVEQELGAYREKAKIKIKVKNKSLFPIAKAVIKLECRNCYGKEKIYEKVVLFLGSRQEEVIRWSFCPMHCGTYEIKVKAIRGYDFLQLFFLSKKKHIGEERTIFVFPEFKEWTKVIAFSAAVNLLEDSDEFSKEKSGDDPSEIFAIREYQEGDRLQRIHWKLSSKKGQLMVKEFSFPIQCNTAILVDLYSNPKDCYKFMDCLLSELQALSLFFIQDQIKHEIIWYDEIEKQPQIQPIQEEEDLNLVIQYLLKSTIQKEEGLILQNFIELPKQQNYANLFYLGSVISEDKLELIANYKITVFEVIEDE